MATKTFVNGWNQFQLTPKFLNQLDSDGFVRRSVSRDQVREFLRDKRTKIDAYFPGEDPEPKFWNIQYANDRKLGIYIGCILFDSVNAALLKKWALGYLFRKKAGHGKAKRRRK